MTTKGLPALSMLLLVAVLVIGSTPAGAAPDGSAGMNSTSASSSVVRAAKASQASTYSRTAVRATNAQRKKRDLVRLRKQKCVQRMAVTQAKRMAKQRRMFHQDLRKVLNRCRLTMAGENVAYGYPTGRSVVNQGWMHSPGHRANILQPRYRLIGVGARKGGGRWYVAQVFGRR